MMTPEVRRPTAVTTTMGKPTIIESTDAILARFLEVDLLLAGALSLPRPARCPDVAAIELNARGVRILQERTIAQAMTTSRPRGRS